MDELLRQLNQFPDDLTAGQNVIQASFAIVLSFLLSMPVVYTYRHTHQGTSYSQAYAQTLVLMCVVTSVIMLIIGSNIARAFSLVGALSIIRFRSAVKDPRDVGFIFFAMAIGMAVGTRFYLIGIVLTFLLCGINFGLTKFNIGAKPFSETLLKVLVGEDLDYEASFEPAFYTHLQSYALLSVDAADDESIEVTYSVKFKSGAAEKQLLDSMKKIPGTQRVSLLHGLQNINV